MLKNKKYLAKAYHNLGNNSLKKGDYERAIEFYDNAMVHHTSDKDRFISLMDKGDSYLRLGNLELATIDLKKAESLYESANKNPDYSRVYQLLGAVYKGLGDFEIANGYNETFGKIMFDFNVEKEQINKHLNKRTFENIITNYYEEKQIYKERLITGAVLTILAVLAGLAIYYWRRRDTSLRDDILEKVNGSNIN